MEIGQSRHIDVILRRSITLDHPRWTREQIVTAVREALQGRGDYPFLAADLLAADWTRATRPGWTTAQLSPG